MKVLSLPDTGALKTVPYGSRSTAPVRDVSINQEVSVWNIQSSRSQKVLAFFPPEGDDGFTTSFTFKVIDVIGTSSSRMESAETYTATLTFEGSVVNSKPVFSSITVAPQTFRVGETEDREFLWSNTGDDKLTYTLSPSALPAGLAYDGDGPDDAGVDPGQNSAPRFTGTPVRVTAAQTYTLTVSDSDGETGAADEDTRTFDIEVVDSEVPLTAPTNLNAELGANAGEVDLTWDAIAVASRWEVRYKQDNGSYGNWLPITDSDATTTGHTVTGLPDGASYTFAVRAVNGSGNGPAAETSIGLAGLRVTPSSLTVNEGSSGTFDVSLATEPTATVTVRLTSDDTDVTVNPTSLTFTTTNYSTAQTVTVNMAANPTDGNATITLTAGGGDYSNRTATVLVILNALPSFDGKTITDQTYTQNTAIPTLNLPEADGGNAPLTYTLTPTPPAGLAFDATARTLTGTPTTPQTATEYTYTVTDADGDTASLTFKITIAVAGAGLDVSETSLRVPGGGSDTFTVKLATAPSGPVTVAVASNESDVTVSPVILSFSTTNYATPQTVTVNMAELRRPFGGNGTVALSASGGGYNGIAASVEVASVPVLKSIERSKPTESVTNSDRVRWRVSFSERVHFNDAFKSSSYVTAFSPDLTNPPAPVVSPGALLPGCEGSRTYDVTIGDFDASTTLDDYNGTVTLTLKSDARIRSCTGVSIGDRTPTGPVEAFTLDNIAPTVTITGVSGTVTAAVDATFTFSEPVTGFEISDITLTNANSSDFAEAGSADGTTYTARITPKAVGEFSVGVEANEAQDAAGNGNTAATTVTATYQTPNNPPVVVSEIPDVDLNQGVSETVDLSTVFSDPDNDPLTFSAVSSDTDLVTASVDGNTLTYKAQLPGGAATVTVTADDGKGGTVDDVFEVTTLEPPNDPPTVDKPIADLTLTAGETRDVNVSQVFKDPDNDPLTYLATSADPSKATVSVKDAIVTVEGVAAGTSTVTVTADDGKDGKVDDEFVVTVEADDAPSFGTATIDDKLYTQGVAIAKLTLPEASGGNGALSYTLEPALPAGLAFDADSREITGTPTAVSTAASYDYRATDADGDSATLKFTIEVKANTAPSFGTATVPAQTYTRGEAITALQLPAATGGNGALTYAIAPALPNGLAFSAGKREITGTPTAVTPEATYSYSATDADGDAATLTFTIEVVAPVNQPPVVDNPIPDQTLSEGKSGTVDLSTVFSDPENDPLNFGAVSSDTAQVTVAVVDSTLTFTAVSAGAPTLTVTADDNKGGKVNDVFVVTVVANELPSFGTETIAHQRYTLNTAIATLNFPVATGGNAPLTYSLSPVAPAGLTFDADARTLTGTPTASRPATAYTYTVTDADGDTASLSFNITITDPQAPPAKPANLSATAGDTEVTLNWNDPNDASITKYQYVYREGLGIGLWEDIPGSGASTTSYTVTGLTNGTEYSFQIRAVNNGGNSDDSDTVTATPRADTTPSFGTETIADQNYTRNTAIATLNLPAATGGNAPLTYSLSPAAPAGLTFDAAARTLTGTPTAVQSETAYTYTVTDADGDTASLTFNITITLAQTTTPSSDNIAVIVTKPHTKLPASRDSDNVFPFKVADTRSEALFYGVKVLSLPATGALKTVPYGSRSTAPVRDVSINQEVSVWNIQSSRSQKVLAFFPPEGDDGFTTSFTFKVIDVIGTSSSRMESAETYTATLTFEGSVVNSKPVFSSITVAPQTFRVGETEDREFLWSNTGDGKLTYTLSPSALPAGLAYDGDGPDDAGVDPGQNSAPRFTGTPVRVTAAQTYTLTVSDSDNQTGAADEDTRTFDIEVVDSEVPLTAPTNLKAELGANAGEVDLTWDAIAVASRWEVRYKQDNGSYGNWLPITDSDATTTGHTVTGLPDGASYTFAVRAVNGSGNGPAAETSIGLAGLRVTPSSLTVNEGGSGTFDVSLATEPTATVTVRLTSDDTDVTVNPTSLTFTTTNYSTAQTVTVNMAANPTDGSATVTLTAAGGDYAGRTATVAVTANALPSFGTQTIADQTYPQGTAITTLNLPQATGGDGTLAYTLTPTPPAGLTFNATARTLTGTPTAPQAATEYTYTATDADGDTAELTFDIRITPTLTLGGVADANLAENTAYTGNATLTGTPVGNITWALTGDDANANGFTLSNQSNTGATVTLGAKDFEVPTDNDTNNIYVYTLTATDDDGNSDTVNVAITITNVDEAPAKPANLTAAPGDTEVTLTWTNPNDSTITRYQVRQAQGATIPATTAWTDIANSTATTTTHTVDNLTNGTTYAFQIRAVVGTANGPGSDTVTATPTATVTPAIQVTPTTLEVDEGGSNTFDVTLVAVPTATVTVTLTSDDGDVTVSPTPLTFTTTSYSTAQTVTVNMAANPTDGAATVTLTAAAGNYAGLTATVSVTSNALPNFDGKTITDQTYTQGTAITTLNLPEADGGDTPLTYTLSPDAPTGLTFSDTARTLTGTPTETQTATEYTYTVTDDDGDVATLTFNITIIADGMPSFGSTTIDDQNYVQNTAITMLALPRATGGDGTLTYSLSPAPPAGLMFSASARTLSGTPTGTQTATEYTYTARDEDGDTATLTFNITITADGTVEPPPPPPPPPNNAPVLLASAGDQTLLVDERRTLTIADLFNDPDRDVLSYTATADDSSVVTVDIDSTERLTLTGVALGEANVTITASDGRGGEASDTFTVTVVQQNESPVVRTPLTDQTITVDQTRQVDVSGAFTDANGDALTYTAVSADETVVTVAVAGNTLTLTGVSAGAAGVTVTADDGYGGAASDQFTVTVTLSNEAPEVATPLSDQSLDVDQAQQVELGGVFTDADGDALTYTAVSEDESVVTVALTGNTLTLTGISAGDATITVTADDGRGGTASDRFAVTVVMPNRGPTVAMPLFDRELEVDQTLQVDVSAVFTDADGDALTYSAVSDDESIVTVTLSGSDLTLTGVSVGAADITVTASDATGAEASDTFAVTVSEVPIDAPLVTDLHEDLLPQFTLSVVGRTTQVIGSRISAARSGTVQATRIFGQSPRPAPSTTPSTTRSVKPVEYGVEPGLPLLGIDALPPGGVISSDLEANTGTRSGAVLLGNEIALAQSALAQAFGSKTHAMPSVESRVDPVALGPQTGGAKTETESGPVLLGNEIAMAQSAFAQAFGNNTQALPGMESRVDPFANGARSGGRTQMRADAFDVFDTPGGWEYRRRLDMRQLLNRASFVLPLNFGADDGSESGEAGKVVTLWGEGSYTDLRSKGNNAVNWDGGLASFHLGADIEATEQLLLGAALSRTEARFDYTDRSDARRTFTGDYDISLTSLHPYADWAVSQDLSVWGSLGYGLGELDLTVDDDDFRQESDLDLYSAALGVTGRFFRSGGWQLGYKGEAMYAAMSVEDAPDVDVQRVRAVLEGRHMAATEGGQFEQFAELGVRADGGDAQSGAGVDLAGGLRYATETGWAAQLRGAGLLANSNYREWQVSGLLEKAYQADGTGLMMKLTPHYRPTRSLGSIEGGAQQLWERNIEDMVRGQRSPTSDEYRFGMETEVGYGLFIRGRLWTVYSRTSGLGERSRRFILGTEMSDVLMGGSVLRVGFEGVREESWNISPEHSFWLNLEWGYR